MILQVIGVVHLERKTFSREGCIDSFALFGQILSKKSADKGRVARFKLLEWAFEIQTYESREERMHFVTFVYHIILFQLKLFLDKLLLTPW